MDVLGEVLVVAQVDVALRAGNDAGHDKAKGLVAQIVEQQARADVGIVWLLLDQRAGGHRLRKTQLVQQDAVVQVAPHLGHDRVGRHACEACTRGRDNLVERSFVERFESAILEPHVQARQQGGRGQHLALASFFSTFLGALVAVEDESARNLVLARAHQRELYLVLDVLDVDGAGGIRAAGERVDDLPGQRLDGFVNAAGRRRPTPFDRDEGLGNGN